MEGKAAVSEALKDSQAQNGCMLPLSHLSLHRWNVM